MESSSTISTILSSDPVSSLRAAALSTRKSKRKKPPPEQPITLSLRPPPSSDSFQLDYGQEDTTDNTSKPSIIPPAPDPLVKREKTPMPLEDIQMREEGEISDEEGPPPLPIPSNDHTRKPPETPVFLVPEAELIQDGAPTIPVALPAPQSLTSEVPQSLPLVDRISDPVPDTPHMSELDQNPDVPMLDIYEQPPGYDLGPDRVRPGLDMSQDEYDAAKDLVLDLLGWGVPFDHLVECGISKHLIFYVFNELDLCLPDTFDLSGIAPYSPELFTELHPAVVISPTIPEGRASSIDSEEVVQDDATSDSVAPLMATKHPLPPIEFPKEADLHDMERRRRQELLARKAAVQASRKLKQSASLEPLTEPSLPNDSMTVDQDTVDVPPYAATETVEDFLNSLGAGQGLDTSPRSAFSAPAQSLLESRINIHDHSINGQVPDMNDHGQDAPSNSSVSESFSVSSRQGPVFSTAPPSSSSEPPPSSVASTASAFSQVSAPVPDATHRRGVKRPVASDFVDFDPPPKRHENHLNGAGGITRRLNSRMSFQNINSRRLVIDLSDSEDEDNEQTHRTFDDPPPLWRDKRAHLVKFPSPAPIKPISSGTISPAVLEQKELEIRQMRELIAKREEETRLRKLALAKSACANSGQSAASTPVIQAKHVKVDEVDSMMMSANETDDTSAQALEDSHQSESATPSSADADGREHSLSPEVPGVPSNMQEPQADLPVSDGEGQDRPNVSVDADQITSPSAQMNTEPTPSALPKQDARKQQDSQILNHDYSQVEDNDQDTFSSYRSPFDLYPLLRGHGPPVSSSSHLLSSSDMYTSSRPLLSSDSFSVDTEKPGFYSSTFSSSSLLPDLKPLKLATLAKSLDPFKRLCQFEVPGGGTCRDEGCEDIHLSRLEDANHIVALEPNDEDTANYLFDKLPPSWRHDHHVASPSRILSVLHNIHRRNLNNHLQFEDRVSQALDLLVSTPTT